MGKSAYSEKTLKVLQYTVTQKVLEICLEKLSFFHYVPYDITVTHGCMLGKISN